MLKVLHATRGWLRSLVDPVTRLVEENQRVGWIIHEWGGGKAWEKGTGNYREGWNKNLKATLMDIHGWGLSTGCAQQTRQVDKMHGWGPHSWNIPSDPWTGGELHKLRATVSERIMCLLFLCLSDENKYYFRSWFSYFLSYLFFLLPPSMDRAYPTRRFFILR